MEEIIIFLNTFPVDRPIADATVVDVYIGRSQVR
jgi:hypothetical protein